MSPSRIYLTLLTLLASIASTHCQTEVAATAVATVVNGFVVAVTVTDGGRGYKTPPAVYITGGGGVGASAVTTILDGKVDRVIVTDAGSGYSSSPEVVIARPIAFSDGLVAYFPFEGNARDESGMGNHGEVFGPDLVTDRFGNQKSAYRFDGIDDYILVQNSPSLENIQAETVSFWFAYEAQATQDFHTPISKYRATVETGTDGFYGYMWDEGFAFTFGAPNHPPELGHEYPLLAHHGEWFHILMTYGDGEQEVYFNGKMVNSDRRNAQLANKDPITIGSYNATWPPRRFTGQIDDIRIYNRRFGSNEVAALYRLEAPPRPRLSIRVRSVQVTMALVVGKRYQLRASIDLKTWNDAGEPFVAVEDTLSKNFDVLEVGQYFDLIELQ